MIPVMIMLWIQKLFLSDAVRDSYTPSIYDNVITTVQTSVQRSFKRFWISLWFKILMRIKNFNKTLPLLKSFSNEKNEQVTKVSCGLIIFILLLPMWVRYYFKIAGHGRSMPHGYLNPSYTLESRALIPLLHPLYHLKSSIVLPVSQWAYKSH